MDEDGIDIIGGDKLFSLLIEIIAIFEDVGYFLISNHAAFFHYERAVSATMAIHVPSVGCLGIVLKLL